MMDMNGIVAALGGTSEAAKVFGVSPQAVSNWKADGRFPRSRRYDALLIMQARGIAVDPAVFSDGSEVAA
jgi:hypothetical protein